MKDITGMFIAGLCGGIFLGMIFMGVILYSGNSTCIDEGILDEACKLKFGEETKWDESSGHVNPLVCVDKSNIQHISDKIVLDNR